MIYLDNAATSWPKPELVYREMINCMKSYGANPGRSGHKMAMIASEKIYECRENISQLFSIPNPLCISFTSNTTESLNMGIKGILKPGDHVITTSMEHNSVLRPLKKLESLGVALSIAKADAEGQVNIIEILKHIKKNTQMIVVTHASNVTGTINPVNEIGKLARKYNLIYMVDAAQTAGIYPVDVEKMNVDILAFPGHKGLLGPQGTGGLYIREGLLLDTLKEGGTGSISESFYQPDFAPDRYESGTLNTPGIAGLNEGAKYILKTGITEIMRHEQELTKSLLEGLYSIKKVSVYGKQELEQRVGVISINIEGRDCVEVCNELDENYNIASRAGLHCAYMAHQTIGTLHTGTIRLSIGHFNTRKDVNKVLKAVNQIASY
ncbi:MAG: aminotransferase class V-fold PLP-dependent enzyme [Clostridia bacterium]